MNPENFENLEMAIEWMRNLISGQLEVFYKKTDKKDTGPLNLYDHKTWIDRFILNQEPTEEEFVILMLGVIPHVDPSFFNKIISGLFPDGTDLQEFGGVRGANHRGIIPTGETAQFILAGDDLEKRLEVQSILSNDHWFSKKHILWLETVAEGEPAMSGRIILDPEIVEQITVGTISIPRFSSGFPAEYIETEMDWDDLVLQNDTMKKIREIEDWIKYNNTFLYDWGMKKRVRPGYRALFYGPPGTGKTLTATLLGKFTDRKVFRIDLSRVTSKYIGETEKNLSRLFDKAENKDWILFFDEADALFGKRTDIRDAHDRYANQEVSYLLQRIETCNGLVILASNKQGNIDEAFSRRFQAIIHFPVPGHEERHRIWCNSIPGQIKLSDDIDLCAIASRYELCGGSIINIIHHCSIEALADKSMFFDTKRLETAIKREFIKEGKIV